MTSTAHVLHLAATASLLIAGLCAAAIAIDVVRRPQRMAVMNVVWPVTALFGSLLLLWVYARVGRARPAAAKADHDRARQPPDSRDAAKQPFPIAVAKGALHCGAGCTLGDIAAEGLALAFPAIATWFGWHTVFADRMYAVWVLDFLFAFVIGVAFQYFAIAPMRQLSVGAGLKAALKADALSLTSWQVGMYGFMAFAQFYLFGQLVGRRFEADTPEFWLAMQGAMVAGFVTAYPVNWALIRSGLKERM